MKINYSMLNWILTSTQYDTIKHTANYHIEKVPIWVCETTDAEKSKRAKKNRIFCLLCDTVTKHNKSYVPMLFVLAKASEAHATTISAFRFFVDSVNDYLNGKFYKRNLANQKRIFLICSVKKAIDGVYFSCSFALSYLFTQPFIVCQLRLI